jgi:hypothetical protein
MKSTSTKTSRQHAHVRALRALFSVIGSLMLFGLEATMSEAATTPSGGVYQGVTSQGLPGYIRVARSGARITKATVTVTVHCTHGESFTVPEEARSLTVTPDGRFKGTASDEFTEEGVTFQLFESLSGRFNRQRTAVTAKSQIRVSARFPDGVTDTCESGIVTLRARK